MALKTRNNRAGVVSNSTDGGPVVRGSRGVRGRIIGEVLSGGRNVLGVPVKMRQAPRPTRQSAPHKVHPTAKKKNDYSDFGLDDPWDDLRDNDDDYVASTLPYGYKPDLGASRPSVATTRSPLVLVIGTALAGQGLLFMLVFVYAFIMIEFAGPYPALLASPIPLLLAVLCGFNVGRSAKNRFLSGIPFPLALLGGLLGSLLVGVALYAYAYWLGFVPLYYAMASLGLDLPRDVYEYASIIDMGVKELFASFRLASYAVVPLFGAALGAVFGKKA